METATKREAWVHWGSNSKVHLALDWPDDPNESAPNVPLACGRTFNRDGYWERNRGPHAQIGIWNGRVPDSLNIHGGHIVCKRCAATVEEG